jgi:hypothetical protein
MDITPGGICVETSDGVIIEGMDISMFGRWVYPPTRENWWFWAALFFLGMFGLLFGAARLMPIQSATPIIIREIVAPQTPAPGQAINPKGEIVQKPVGL